MTNNLPSFVPQQPYVSGAGTGGAGGGGLGALAGAAGGGGYSGEISEQRQNQNQLRSTNKNKLSITPDLSGAAGQRGAVFNFGTNVNPILSSAGGSSTVIWIVAGVGILGVAALFLLRKK